MDGQGGTFEEKVLAVLERSAKAQEDLILLAREERDIETITDELPPVCPRCQSFDPRIRNEGGEGKLSEFVLVADCGNCGNKFLAVPFKGWLAFRDVDELKAYKEGGNQ